MNISKKKVHNPLHTFDGAGMRCGSAWRERERERERDGWSVDFRFYFLDFGVGMEISFAFF